MNDYYSVRIDARPCTADITDLMAAFLADAGFESFEPDANGLTAYIGAASGDGALAAREALSDFPMEMPPRLPDSDRQTFSSPTSTATSFWATSTATPHTSNQAAQCCSAASMKKTRP